MSSREEDQEQRQQQQPFYENEEEWERDQEEAVEKLDKRIGWYKAGNGDAKDHSRETWSEEKLLARYEHLREVTLKNIPNLWTGLEFAISVKTILNIKGCTLPFSGILLGPPSSWKTVIIELFRGHKHTFYTDNFSPKSLVSHNSAVARDKLKEIDMLPKIKNKLFLTPELAPVFGARDEDLLQVLGILTRVADGHGYESDSGTQGHRGYSEPTMFTWIGAAVDIPYKVHKLLGTLGPKLYFFRLPRVEEDEDHYFDIRNEAFNQKEQEVRNALLEYLAYFEVNAEVTVEGENGLPKIALETEKDEELAYRIIIRLAKLLARLRATVPTWETRESQGSEYAYAIANIEVPSRAITQLANLARGHALSKCRKYITLNDIPIVIHTALSTATMERVRILDLLIANKGSLTTSQIVDFLNTTKPTALRTMTELKATGLVTMTYDQEEYNAPREIRLKPEFDWFLTEQFAELRNGCKEKTPPCLDPTEEACKEKNPPCSMPLISYDYQINKIIMVNREKALHQSVLAHGGKFSLHQLNNRIERSADNSIEYPPKCYHCNVNGFTTQDQYERHVVNYHKKLPCYPGPADLERLGLTPQGMSWEQQLPRDQYFEFELESKK